MDGFESCLFNVNEAPTFQSTEHSAWPSEGDSGNPSPLFPTQTNQTPWIELAKYMLTKQAGGRGWGVSGPKVLVWGRGPIRI